MRFYYFSLLSWMLWAVYGLIVITLVSVVWTKVLKLRLRNPAYWVLAIAVLVAPWTEELWIAYNFDRLCRKDAGILINKTVEVDGYYNGTGTVNRLVGGPHYKFIESPEGDGKYRRVERASEQEKAGAIAWYSRSKGKPPGEKEWIAHQISKDTRVVVETDTEHAWRITTLDRPTARYHFYMKTGERASPVAHKIWKEETGVLDAQTGETLGRYIVYSRLPYWFYIALGQPPFGCDGPDGGPNTKHDALLIYKQVLVPAK